MEATKAKLKQAQAAPPSQREAILQGMTGENLTGDMLTATIWGYFASLQSHGVIASSQAETFGLPALSYGLFHAQVKPNKLFGVATTGITFEGLNMDVGHLRHMRWVKDDNPNNPINNKPELKANGKSAAQNRWIAYNKMRGQYSSAIEHATPEAFWVDKSSCWYINENGQMQNPALQPCQQAISAVKAIAIAESQGQKVYTITRQNAATALPALSIGGYDGADIRNAVNAGKTVTVHEKPITAFGWRGYGYIITDPDTGVGSYIISGSGNGGSLEDIYRAVIQIIMSMIGVVDVIAGAILTALDTLKNVLLMLVDGCSLSIIFQYVLVVTVLAVGFSLMAPGAAPLFLALMVLMLSYVIFSAVLSSFRESCKAS
jgi:hypothetical protein